jgi:hypothetical protein
MTSPVRERWNAASNFRSAMPERCCGSCAHNSRPGTAPGACLHPTAKHVRVVDRGVEWHDLCDLWKALATEAEP